MVTLTDLQAILPLIILAAGAVGLLTLISFYRNLWVSFFVTGITLVGAFFSIKFAWDLGRHPIPAMFTVDHLGLVFIGVILISAFAVAHFALDYFRKFDDNRDEFFVLLLIGTLGGCSLAISSHFIAFFLGLELMSVPLYAMVAYTLKRDASLEAGFKYLILAAAAAAFLLFGFALIYTETRAMDFSVLAVNLAQLGQFYNPILVHAGLAMVFGAICFKLSLVPFHWWTPDIYQGAPAPVSAFLSTVSKVGVVAVFLRFALDLDLANNPTFLSGVYPVVILSVLVGNLLALAQKNLKRLLAYSSIAHLGYLMITFLISGNIAVEATILYMVTYSLTSLGTFGVLSALSSSEKEVENLDDVRGLYFQRPFLSIIFTLMMLSLAGIPLTAGFMGKFLVVAAGAQDLEAMAIPLLTLVAGSAIGLYYYLKVVWTLFQKEPEAISTAGNRPTISEFAMFALILVSVLTLFIGIYPTPVTELLRFIANTYQPF